MILSITFIELKSAWHFFSLSFHALQITKELKKTKCLSHKNTGFWTKHYTMTLWPNEASMNEFTRKGAHAEAMKKSATIAKELGFVTINSDKLLGWKEAKSLLQSKGRKITFS
jgi:hypothetical protein